MALARQVLQVLRPRQHLLLRPVRSLLDNSRTLSTTVVMSKEQIEELQKNPYFDKYADKIAKLQQ